MGIGAGRPVREKDKSPDTSTHSELALDDIYRPGCHTPAVCQRSVQLQSSATRGRSGGDHASNGELWLKRSLVMVPTVASFASHSCPPALPSAAGAAAAAAAAAPAAGAV